nr:uncharacterized protein LOC126534380 isoform X3 [Dermacentor andersoni]XP_054928823.1 uncharacterized protein LOC126534380 isoform X3 [Dermacentor andersoni]
MSAVRIAVLFYLPLALSGVTLKDLKEALNTREKIWTVYRSYYPSARGHNQTCIYSEMRMTKRGYYIADTHYEVDGVWCTCMCCVLMEDEENCLCCQEVQEIRKKQKRTQCVTSSRQFRTVCLSRAVLEVALAQKGVEPAGQGKKFTHRCENDMANGKRVMQKQFFLFLQAVEVCSIPPVCLASMEKVGKEEPSNSAKLCT